MLLKNVRPIAQSCDMDDEELGYLLDRVAGLKALLRRFESSSQNSGCELRTQSERRTNLLLLNIWAPKPIVYSGYGHSRLLGQYYRPRASLTYLCDPFMGDCAALRTDIGKNRRHLESVVIVLAVAFFAVSAITALLLVLLV